VTVFLAEVSRQEAQLSQTGCAMLHVTEYFAKKKVIEFEMVSFESLGIRFPIRIT